MNFRSATINSRVSAVPAAETSWLGDERGRKLIGPVLMPRPQQLHDLIG